MRADQHNLQQFRPYPPKNCNDATFISIRAAKIGELLYT
jgi:hypothetical protein